MLPCLLAVNTWFTHSHILMSARTRPEDASEGFIYLVHHKIANIYKIGITLDWGRRAKQLGVGRDVECLLARKVFQPRKLERELHRRYSRFRVPQSEWFHLSSAQVEAIETAINVTNHNFTRTNQQPQPDINGERRAVTDGLSQDHNSNSQQTGNRQRTIGKAIRAIASEQYPSASEEYIPIPILTSTPSKNDSTGKGWRFDITLGVIATLGFPVLPIFLSLFTASRPAGWLAGFGIQIYLISLYSHKKIT